MLLKWQQRIHHKIDVLLRSIPTRLVMQLKIPLIPIQAFFSKIAQRFVLSGQLDRQSFHCISHAQLPLIPILCIASQERKDISVPSPAFPLMIPCAVYGEHDREAIASLLKASLRVGPSPSRVQPIIWTWRNEQVALCTTAN